MKHIVRFSKLFLPTAILSTILAVGGIVSYILFGFNLGIDFQAGLMEEVQFAPTAFNLTYSGSGNASVTFDRSGIYIVLSGSGVESRTVPFTFNQYGTIGAMTAAMNSQVEGLTVQSSISGDKSSQWLVHSAQGNPQLGSVPYVVHYLEPGSKTIPIQEVRDALTSLGQSVSVQQLGDSEERHYMIRLEDDELNEGGAVSAERITGTLETYFGAGEVVILHSDYVGSRFSKNLTDQAGILLGLTLILILAYASIRFKPQYAIAAVIAIMHDALMMVAFVVWTRMEFNTTTIAAVLTILGYSINDTIVIFDRIRETRRIYPDMGFIDILDRSLTETLSRTIITTLTTMLAVLSLYIFTTGSMKDFALVLLVGMVSGVYSTIWIASGFVNYWEEQKEKKAKKKLSAPATPAKPHGKTLPSKA
jgi:preprotein translocase subunit SecF